MTVHNNIVCIADVSEELALALLELWIVDHSVLLAYHKSELIWNVVHSIGFRL